MLTNEKITEEGTIPFNLQIAPNTIYNIIRQLHDGGVKAFEASIIGETVAKDKIVGTISHEHTTYWPLPEEDDKIIWDKIAVFREHDNTTISISTSYVKPNTFFHIDFTPKKK